MSYESAMARVQELRQMTEPTTAARTRSGSQSAGGVGGATAATSGSAFSQQLQLAMQQQSSLADGAGTDPAAGGVAAPYAYGSAYPAPAAYGGAASPYGAGAAPAYGAQSPYGAYPPYGAQSPYGMPAQQAWGMPPSMVGQGGAGVGAPAATAFLTGDVQGLNPQLAARLNEVGRRLGVRVTVESGLRTRAEQERLYQAYLNGTGNLAAPPGSSNHESGNAADVYINGVALASHSQGRRIAEQLGLSWPVGGEPWHIEMSR